MARRTPKAKPPRTFAPHLELEPLGYALVNCAGYTDEEMRADWRIDGEGLALVDTAQQWRWGDWLLEGERRWGDIYTEAEEISGKAKQTLENYRWVASRFAEISLRRENLSWRHHSEVAGIENIKTRTEWLDRAEAKGWSVIQLREALSVERNKPWSSPPVPTHRSARDTPYQETATEIDTNDGPEPRQLKDPADWLKTMLSPFRFFRDSLFENSPQELLAQMSEYDRQKTHDIIMDLIEWLKPVAGDDHVANRQGTEKSRKVLN